MAKTGAGPTNKQRFEYFHGSIMTWEEFKALVKDYTYYRDIAVKLEINPKNCFKWQQKAREELGIRHVRVNK